MNERTGQRVMVIGTGMMGTGIAELCAIRGYQVLLAGRRAVSLDRAAGIIRDDMAGFAAEGFLTGSQAEQALARIQYTLSLSDGYGADYVIESITEDLAAKQAVFRELDAHCRPDAVLATDTSTLPVTGIASVTKQPQRVAGMHFFTCVPKNRLLEVIPGKETSGETLARIRDFARCTGKTMVTARDSAGFIVNRLQARTWNEAASLVAEGAQARDVDLALLHTVRPNWGILALVDFCGLELMDTISHILWKNLGTPRYQPCPLLRQMLEQGRSGRSAGKGFFDYADAKNCSNDRKET